jgi:hypothetical protein
MIAPIIKFVIISAIVLSIGALIGQLIPSTFTSSVNGSIVYFLESMAPMNFLIPMDTVYSAIQIFFNFIYGILLFIIIKWAAHLFSR